MKTRTITLLLAVLLLSQTVCAQRARKVSIIDFVNAFVAEPEDEFTGAVADVWAKYRKHQPQDKDVTLVVDTKHGFMSYEHVYPEDFGSITMQMCYWNCADGRHKLVAQSVWSIHQGHVICGQFDGLSFMLYDNKTGHLEYASPEDYGIDTAYGIDSVISGYNAEKKSFFVTDRNDITTYMTEEEYDEWSANRPINTITLPREGKDILLVTHRGPEQTITTWEWNGSRFNLKK